MRKLIWKLYEDSIITIKVANLLLDELDKKTKRNDK